jgi:hypothetical protein
MRELAHELGLSLQVSGHHLLIGPIAVLEIGSQICVPPRRRCIGFFEPVYGYRVVEHLYVV